MGVKEKAPECWYHPKGLRTQEGVVPVTAMVSVHPGTREGTSEHRCCAECGTTERPLMAAEPGVGKGYEGPMYCGECNPRFRFVDTVWSGLERMGRCWS